MLRNVCCFPARRTSAHKKYIRLLYYVAFIIEGNTIQPRRLPPRLHILRMLFRVALLAYGFQIVPIQRYIRIVDVPRLDIADMVDYGSRTAATFANIVLAL